MGKEYGNCLTVNVSQASSDRLAFTKLALRGLEQMSMLDAVNARFLMGSLKTGSAPGLLFSRKALPVS